MSVSDFGKDILEIGFWIYVVELCRLDESVDGCGALTAGIGACEEIILTANGN